MMEENTKGSHRVFLGIRTQIEDGTLLSGSKLPSAAQLCRVFKANRNTVFSALSDLEKAKLICRRKGSGAFVLGEKGELPAPSISETNLPKPESIADAIARDIQLGHWRVDEVLPSRKQLRFRYGTSAPTLTSAVRLLIKRKLLFETGSILRVGRAFAHPRALGKRVCLAGGTRSLSIFQATRPATRFLHFFESEFNRHGVEIDRSFEWNQNFRGMQSQMKTRNSFGTVFMVPSPLSQFLLDTFGDRESKATRHFPQPQNPTVLFSMNSDFHRRVWRNFKAPDRLHILAPDDYQSGMDIAAYLASHGHQKIAFFGYSQERWDRGRFDGLVHGMRSIVGKQASVFDFSANVDPGMLRKPVWLGSERGVESIDRTIAELFKGYQFREIKPHYGIFNLLNLFVVDDDENLHLKPLFKKALGDSSITAWVCAESTAALIGHDVLASNDHAAGGNISLISFDDNDRLQARGIAAHDFQIGQLGYLAAHCILRDIPIRRKRNGLVECPGRIVERGSVARAKR